MNETSSLPHDEEFQPTAAPPFHQLAREVFAVGEFGLFMAVMPMLRMAPRPAQRQPVLVLPGFGGGDASTAPLRSYLSAMGHAVHGWNLGTNWWRTPELVEGVPRRLMELHEKSGQQVSVVGWSAGGIWARELARTHPDVVRQVITLGAPFRLRGGDEANTAFLYNLVKHRHVPEPDERLRPEHHRAPLTVPTTAIYSLTDGVASWQACIETAGDRRENIAVRGTHTGLGHNIAAAYAVADRLAQPQGTWTPFQSPAHLRHLFPTAAVWHNGRAVPLRDIDAA